MQEVWLVFKLVETMLGLFCMAIHIAGFLNAQLKMDFYLYIFVFFVFSVQAMFGGLNICAGSYFKPLTEVIVNSIAAVLYLTASMVAMYNAEKDYYLMYLTEFAAPVHPVFVYSKAQSIGSLAACCCYMLHAFLAADQIIINKETQFDDDQDHTFVQPLKMYLFGKDVHDYLAKYEWFRKIGGNEFGDEVTV